MAIFGRGRKPEHQAGLIYAYGKKDGMPGQYGAVCRCGWSTEPVSSGYPDADLEQQLAAAALAHDPAADTSVGFPLDKPPNG
jgi:hypothetical protein